MAEFGRILAGPVPGLRAHVRSVAADDPEELLTTTSLQVLHDAHRGVLDRLREAWVTWHWQIVGSSALRAVDEVRTVERSLTAGYAGIADEVGGSVVAAALMRQAEAENLGARMVRSSREDLSEGVRRQVSLAVEAGDPVGVLVDRILSRDPVEAHGISGRGVWWRLSYPFEAALTTSSVQVSNTVRSLAVSLWNEAAEER